MVNTNARLNAKTTFATNGCVYCAVVTAQHVIEDHIVPHTMSPQDTSANDLVAGVHKAVMDP